MEGPASSERWRWLRAPVPEEDRGGRRRPRHPQRAGRRPRPRPRPLGSAAARREGPPLAAERDALVRHRRRRPRRVEPGDLRRPALDDRGRLRRPVLVRGGHRLRAPRRLLPAARQRADAGDGRAHGLPRHHPGDRADGLARPERGQRDRRARRRLRAAGGPHRARLRARDPRDALRRGRPRPRRRATAPCSGRTCCPTACRR